jgi:pentatricopeptide repeat protein
MDPDRLAEAIRAACVRAAVTAYEDAGIQGLCQEGRWEAAVGALRSIDLRKLVQDLELGNSPPS